MWQVLLAAAAAAGSGILAKKLINPTDAEQPISDSKQNDQECDPSKALQPQDSIFPTEGAVREDSSQEQGDAINDDGKIFRFSSPETASKELWKKTGSGSKGLKKYGGSKKGKKSGFGEGGAKELAVDQRGNGSAKRNTVCLKKRRTGKHSAGKCESCSSKDNSFGWGVGVGIMYMMSAGKAEISRLNCAMDETAKIVQELKAEITSSKTASLAGNKAETNKRQTEGGTLFIKPDIKSKYKIKPFGPSLMEEGECAINVLTAEQLPEVLEMDQLEAELETELQKLPWCVTASSGSEGRPDISEVENFAEEHHSEDHGNLNLCPYDGVLPAELDKKLCHVLIERQESQIVELEAELHHAHSKLQEKEAELQALKNCVKRLSEFSLASYSDEEIEDKEEDMKKRDGVDQEKLGFEPIKSMVGMKRTMDAE
ncbi:uncharacterized protein LOC105161397 [Sesamum indicum]|uniref:Uncharacterized protein LOC105161397 n=1 Tax=Sesamum indicum TaxID=4182 RepID=A0A6I9T347_SESIN|nr:uncharacterized protein LOC105161397 [Sesamum indicum]